MTWYSIWIVKPEYKVWRLNEGKMRELWAMGHIVSYYEFSNHFQIRFSSTETTLVEENGRLNLKIKPLLPWIHGVILKKLPWQRSPILNIGCLMRDIVLENMEALGKTNRRQPNLLSSKSQIGWSSREARKLSIKE